MYGAKAKDDLMEMKPTGPLSHTLLSLFFSHFFSLIDEQEKELESIELHPLGFYKIEKLDVSMLWLMWFVSSSIFFIFIFISVFSNHVFSWFSFFFFF